MRVASRDNPKFKELRKLADSPLERQRTRSTVLEGIHLCRAYLERVGLPGQCVIGASALGDPEVSDLVGRIPSQKIIELDDRLYAAVSQLEQAIALLFVVDMPENRVPGRLVQDAVLLDRIQDPGNLGTLLRSAAAAGFTTGYLSAGCAAAWGPRVLRAAMGAHFGMTLYEQCDLPALVDSAEVPVYATTSHGGDVLFELSLAVGPCGWVFGNEGQGIDEPLLARCKPVRIPQPGGEESLNVAAAAAVCLFEVVRQRRASRRLSGDRFA